MSRRVTVCQCGETFYDDKELEKHACSKSVESEQRLIYVPYEMNMTLPASGWALVGEAPGAEEEKQRKPFVGRSGQLLRKTLTEELGELPDLITNVVKVRPLNNRTPSNEEMDSWLPLLYDELRRFTTVITAGRSAEYAVGKLMKEYRLTCQHVHIWHPAYILRNRSKETEWREQIKQVKL